MSRNVYIRVVFSSLMVLPLIILVYFIVHFAKYPDCSALYFKNKPVLAVKRIAWPDNGLVTIWFDSTFFANNKDAIVDLMNKYQFSGVISLSKDKSCHTQSLSIHQLIMLRNHGWEITKTNVLRDVRGEHEINDMPASNPRHQAMYDMSDDSASATLPTFLNDTKICNGWLVLYFHTVVGAKEDKAMNAAKLNQILHKVKYSGIPVVIREQVLKVSQ